MKTSLLPVIFLFLAGCASFEPGAQRTETHAAVRLPNGLIVVTDSDHPPFALPGPDAPYPEEAKTRGVHGQVSVEVSVSSRGLVTDVRIISSPDESLSNAARKALPGWTFLPAVQGGNLVSGKIVVKFNFEAK
ncbi:MAG TPA: energy transducer TonB [Candidatus Didemnitutus sp.]